MSCPSPVLSVVSPGSGPPVVVKPRSVLFAGSRNGCINPALARGLVAALSDHGFSFVVGCAPGIDACFRSGLSSLPEAAEASFVACAFASRLDASTSGGLFASVVVPAGLSPAAALRRRTLWLVKRAQLLILFPDDPASRRWGRGSSLAFRAATDQLKPAFVVSQKAPPAAPHYRLFPGTLCGLVKGTWAVPHPVPAGTCDEEV